jgi:glutaredoxin
LAQKSADNQVNIYFFYGDGCPHCAAEEVFLQKLQSERPNVKVHRFEVWNNRDNAKLISSIIQKLNFNLKASSVPITFIGGQAISGYYTDETTGVQIAQGVDYFQAAGDPDYIGKTIANEKAADGASDKNLTIYNDSVSKEKPKEINLPFFGAINTQNLSLGALSVVIGFIDGFNPCAMWVLIFLISLMLGMHNRKRMWVIGITFIFTSGFVYLMFMAAWLNLFLFIGFLFWIRLIIGAVAIASGAYQLREFYINRDGACKVASENKRRKIFEQIKTIINEKSFVLAFVGVIGLAAAVNMVELVCSAGLPAIYTSILSAADLPTWKYYGYLLIYILLYMLDDILVFTAAMVTLHVAGITKKYVRFANLAGGIIILIIGILLIFKPAWLLFG